MAEGSRSHIFKRERRDYFLETRYEALAQSVRITAAVLHHSEEFRTTLQALRADGWLDWHILTAISNVAMNYRFPLRRHATNSRVPERDGIEASQALRSPQHPRFPISQFTPERMHDHETGCDDVPTYNTGTLECYQRTPDIRAIEALLAARYGYWDEDDPHEDPFPEADESGM